MPTRDNTDAEVERIACATCRFWMGPDDDEWNPVRARMGKCKHTPHIEDMMEWSGVEGDYVRVVIADFADRTACATDASGYAAALLTAPEHFCAMHAAALEREAGR